MAEKPKRPSSENAQELGFKRQNFMFPWLSPGELVHCAMRVVLSRIFGAYADKRELQGALAATDFSSYERFGELWIDFVADVGDGFGPTYTIAWLLAQERLDLGLAEGPLPRGQILIMGGDEVYPSPSPDNYNNRTLGPYRAALPYTAPLPYTGEEHPDLYAIPGNHDWYDGLTSFLRVFCTQDWIGGWRTRQSRSYFALKLPHRWWLWGIDVQLESYIDLPQFRYFQDVVGAELKEGDSIILCSSVPSWVHANEKERPEAYVTLDYFERKVIRPRGASVRLALTGDAHHYARYENPADGSQKITAGGGGAYLSATHLLPEELELPPARSVDPGKTEETAWYELVERYPDQATSKRFRYGVFRLPFKNWKLWFLIGVVYLLYAWMIRVPLRPPNEPFSTFLKELSWRDIFGSIGRSQLALLLSAAIVPALIGFTKSGGWRKWGLGLGHGFLHIALIIGTLHFSAWVLGHATKWWLLAIGFVGLVGVVGGLLASWFLALYLVVADLVGCNTNELFAAQGIRNYKNFVRLRLAKDGDDGVLTVYPIKVERTPCRWKLRQDNQKPDYPWFEAVDRPVKPELIEKEPVHIKPTPRPLTVDRRSPATTE